MRCVHGLIVGQFREREGAEKAGNMARRGFDRHNVALSIYPSPTVSSLFIRFIRFSPGYEQSGLIVVACIGYLGSSTTIEIIPMSRYMSAADLGITVKKGDEQSLFKWFLASFLFGKRIGQKIAAATWHVLVEAHERDTPRKLCHCSHAELVKILGEGGYARYDESTADRLALLCKTLIDRYHGRILGIFEASESRADFERRLRGFKGVGQVTVRIFMREAGPALFKSD
jgi:hypothetical protein